MLSVSLSLLLGLGLGWLGDFPEKSRRISSGIMWISLLLLLVLMGINIGANPQVMMDLPKIGLQALVISLLSIAGSVLVTWIFFGKKKRIEDGNGEPVDFHTKSLTWIVVFCVLFGILFGRLIVLDSSLKRSAGIFSQVALGVLMVTIGYDLGCERAIFRKIRALGPKMILVPVCVAVGTLLGSYLAGTILGITASESLSAGAGFGWYSLSGVLLTEIKGPGIGALAFLCNVFREIFAVAIIPFCAQYMGEIVAVAPGGATSMDTTLPIVVKAAGYDASIVSLVTGLVLTSLVPVLVPLFAKL